MNESDQKGIRLNLHIPLCKRLSDYSIALNEFLLEHSVNQIDFSPKSFHVPHISLYVGNVLGIGDIATILDIAFDFSKHQNGFTISSMWPVITKPDDRSYAYCYIPIAPIKKILEMKKLLAHQIGRAMLPPIWKYVAEVPHVTVGYVRCDSFVAADLWARAKSVSGHADAIEVSFAGSRGTCMGAIRRFEFGARR